MSRHHSAPALELTGIDAAYHDHQVLYGITASIQPGTITAVIGPNGAGKSTLLTAALGLLPTLNGEARFFGRPLNDMRRHIGYMPQAASVDWDFPARVEDVVMMGTYGSLGWFGRPGAKQREAVDRAIDRVGIAGVAHHHISQLSGGQKQRTFLARTLVNDPDILLLDEPFAGVDLASEAAITELLQDLAAAGKTIVIVHHNLQAVAKFADQAMLLVGGRLAALGPAAEVVASDTLARAYGIAAQE